MRFIACGDSLFSSRNLKKRLDQKLVSLLLAADGVFTNAEFCTPEPSTPPAAGRGYMTSVRPSLLDEFASLNIRMLSFVNNHTGDYGWQGVLDTMNAAEKRNLIACGLGRSLAGSAPAEISRHRFRQSRHRGDLFDALGSLCSQRQRSRRRSETGVKSAPLVPFLCAAGKGI